MICRSRGFDWTEFEYRADICLRGCKKIFTPCLLCSFNGLTRKAREGCLSKARELFGSAEVLKWYKAESLVLVAACSASAELCNNFYLKFASNIEGASNQILASKLRLISGEFLIKCMNNWQNCLEYNIIPNRKPWYSYSLRSRSMASSKKYGISIPTLVTFQNGILELEELNS